MRGLSKGLLCLITAAFASAANADIIVDGQRLSISDIQNYTVSVNAQGAYTIDITTVDGWVLERGTAAPPVDCNATPNDPACQEPEPPPPPPPPGALNVTLTSNVAVAEIGETVTFSWTAANAVSCDTKWGNQQWKDYVPNPAGGSVGIIMDTLGELQFRLKCEDSAGASQAVGVFVNVSPASNTTSCGASEVPNGFETTWRDYLGDWYPNVSGAEQRKLIGRSNYVSVKFNTGFDSIRGLVQTIQVSDPNRFVSIGRCPGDFTNDNVDPGCYDRQANGGDLEWSTDGSFGTCTLDQNTDYYLNITYVNVENPGSGTLCDTSSCAFNLRVATGPTQ